MGHPLCSKRNSARTAVEHAPNYPLPVLPEQIERESKRSEHQAHAAPTRHMPRRFPRSVVMPDGRGHDHHRAEQNKSHSFCHANSAPARRAVREVTRAPRRNALGHSSQNYGVSTVSDHGIPARALVNSSGKTRSRAAQNRAIGAKIEFPNSRRPTCVPVGKSESTVFLGKTAIFFIDANRTNGAAARECAAFCQLHVGSAPFCAH